jgi:FSR family fosmidomycin resistance protein-like MFS transporter
MLVWRHGYLASFAPDRDHVRRTAGEDDTRALWLLLGVIAFRACAWFGLLTFVPLWEVSLGHSKSYGNHLLALMLLVGGIGTIAAGPAADRFGRRLVLLLSLVATPLLIAAFIVLGGVIGAVCLALVGPCVIGTFGVTAVMSQEYLPTRIGMASGLSIGMSVGLGGIAAVVLGAVADAVDLRTAMWVAAAAPLAAIALAVLLPTAPRSSVRLTDPSVNVI